MGDGFPIMEMIFEEAKATQAAAMLVRLAGGEMNYMALVIHLYKIDREALRQWGVTVTTDRHVAMAHGPVTSNIYDLIKRGIGGSISPSLWATHIKSRGDYKVGLESDPGTSELSRAEIRLIEQVFAADGEKDRYELRDTAHREFSEWRDPGKSSAPISLTEILAAVGASEDEVAHAENSIDVQRSLHSLSRR